MQDTDLGCRIAWRLERHDEAHVHSDVEAQKVNVKRAALIHLRGPDVRHDAPDIHRIDPITKDFTSRLRGNHRRQVPKSSIWIYSRSKKASRQLGRHCSVLYQGQTLV